MLAQTSITPRLLRRGVIVYRHEKIRPRTTVVTCHGLRGYSSDATSTKTRAADFAAATRAGA